MTGCACERVRCVAVCLWKEQGWERSDKVCVCCVCACLLACAHQPNTIKSWGVSESGSALTADRGGAREEHRCLCCWVWRAGWVQHDSSSLALVCRLVTCAAGSLPRRMAAVGAAASLLSYLFLSKCRASAGARGNQNCSGILFQVSCPAEHLYVTFPALESLACCLPEGQM